MFFKIRAKKIALIIFFAYVSDDFFIIRINKKKNNFVYKNCREKKIQHFFLCPRPGPECASVLVNKLQTPLSPLLPSKRDDGKIFLGHASDNSKTKKNVKEKKIGKKKSKIFRLFEKKMYLNFLKIVSKSSET